MARTNRFQKHDWVVKFFDNHRPPFQNLSDEIEREREREVKLTYEALKKLESPSLVEEEEDPSMNNTTVTASPKPNKKRIKNDRGGAKKEEECDAEAWDILSKSFKQVQSVLDHNSDLIKQVNANHQSKIPDNLVKNVSLIREINGNITKVMSIYSDLSFNVSNIVEERRRLKNGGESNLESASNES
ncbi:hypothetical protein NC653_022788 [Populus alba x Populus x berolinensis]|uniref:Protein EARLY FLOWERING 4 domain-containing protein n=1 Tax=Populus alba x Populus x berolinensis TaxID=444605 RepID=A0AAD6QA37_9ROSI|nr:hypothetical protein NC653_022788 [Populus alba x Populus x berolinensis]